MEKIILSKAKLFNMWSKSLKLPENLMFQRIFPCHKQVQSLRCHFSGDIQLVNFFELLK